MCMLNIVLGFLYYSHMITHLAENYGVGDITNLQSQRLRSYIACQP